MAKAEKFFEESIDRTPYSGCAWVAVIVAAFFIIAACFFFWLGSVVKHSALFHIKLPQMNADGSDDFLERIKQDLGASTDKAADQAKQQAEDAIKQETDKQIKAQQEALQQEAADQLKAAIPTP